MRTATARGPVAGALPDPAKLSALVVDEQGSVRQALKDLLVSIGIGQVQVAREPLRAIQMMESGAFNLVLCEVKFRSPMSGCQVLEYVRTRRLIAPSAAFLLVASAADRSLVETSREWQPDGLLLKPVVPDVLAPRIEQAIRRRAAFAPIHAANEQGDAAAVLARVDAMIARAGGPTLEMLRWRTQALIDLGRFQAVADTARQALAMKASLPWAELALVRCDRDAGRLDEACEQLEAMIRVNPYLGGAYDLLIEIHQQAGRTAAALQVAQAAAKPLASASRLRTVGEIAYAQGELDLAGACYQDLIQMTGTSLTRSPIDVGMLGQVMVSQGEAQQALQLVANAAEHLNGDTASQALVASVISQAHSSLGDTEVAQDFARKALELAATGKPPEAVAMLVAQGAFGAGMGEAAQALVRQTLSARPAQAPVGALARKVISDAGLAPEDFVTQAMPAPTRAAPTVAVPEPLAVPAATPPAAQEPPAPARTPAQDMRDAIDCLHQARFDEAVAHIDRARELLPSNPLVLMATVQVYMMRMHAKGFDAACALEVRRCLSAVDRQIPGELRVFGGRPAA